eukprot:633436-Pleurochrysis_carterae.AAC.1
MGGARSAVGAARSVAARLGRPPTQADEPDDAVSGGHTVPIPSRSPLSPLASRGVGGGWFGRRWRSCRLL